MMAVTGESVIRTGHEQRQDARDDARLEWWRDARFGMFIHWGLYALPAGHWQGEWCRAATGDCLRASGFSSSRAFPGRSTARSPAIQPCVRADAWVSLARRAGQKYLVITAKHHDGFCLFDSASTDYDIADATPFGRDPLQELARACQEQGIKLCFYYSQTQDWHHPGGVGNDWDGVETEKDIATTSMISQTAAARTAHQLRAHRPDLVRYAAGEHRGAESRSGRPRSRTPTDSLVNGRIGNGAAIAQSGDNTFPEHQLGVDWERLDMTDTWV